MAGRDAFLPTAAHAADDDAGRTSHSDAGAAPIANNLPDVNISTAAETPETVAYQHASTMAAYGATPVDSALAAAKVVPVAELGPELHAGHGGGGGGGGSYDHSSDTSGAHDGVALSLAALDHDGSPLDLGLHLGIADAQVDLGSTLSSLFGSASEILGHAPLVGGLLEDVGHAAGGVANAVIEPVVSLLGLHGEGTDAHGFGSALGLPGQLLFSDHASAASGNELATSLGGYSNYGLALSLGDDAGSQFGGEAAAHTDILDALPIDTHLSDHLPGSDVHAGSDALHVDQTILRTASDLLA